MSAENFQTPNEQVQLSEPEQKRLKQVVDVTRPDLKKVVDIDYNYLERKEKYEQAKKEGLAVEPPVPSSFHMARREQFIASLQSREQKNQLEIKTVPVIEQESSYDISVEQLLESDALEDLYSQIKQSSVRDIMIEPHNQLLANTGTVVNSGEQQSAKQVLIPYNPNAGIHQNLGITGVVPANTNAPVLIGNFMVDNWGYYFQNKEGKWVRFTDFS